MECPPPCPMCMKRKLLCLHTTAQLSRKTFSEAQKLSPHRKAKNIQQLPSVLGKKMLMLSRKGSILDGSQLWGPIS